jgi:hypothetical protein
MDYTDIYLWFVPKFAEFCQVISNITNNILSVQHEINQCYARIRAVYKDSKTSRNFKRNKRIKIYQKLAVLKFKLQHICDDEISEFLEKWKNLTPVFPPGFISNYLPGKLNKLIYGLVYDLEVISKVAPTQNLKLLQECGDLILQNIRASHVMPSV